MDTLKAWVSSAICSSVSFHSLHSHLFDGELEKKGLLSGLILLSTDPAVAKEVQCGCIVFKYTGTRKPEK